MATIDLSRHAADFRKHYTGVRMQQGRVLTDDDFNDQARLDAEDTRRTRIDVIGPFGSPDDGFLIANPVVNGTSPTFTIKAGSFYLGGQRLTLDEDEVQHLQKDWLQQGADAGDRPAALTGVRFDFAYLEVWQQPVSAIEDSELLEVALGGPDTSVRIRNMRRVRVLSGVASGNCNDAWAALLANRSSQGTINKEFELVPDARLRVEPDGTTGTNDLCSPPVAGGYLGAENQAIRVQIVGPGEFTWGYNNVAPLYRVQLGVDTGAQRRRITLLTLPKDQAHWPLAGQTAELLPWSAVLANGQKISELHGHLAKVTTSYNPDDNFFDIDVAPSNDASGQLFGETWKQRTGPGGDAAVLDDEGEFFYLRVWNRGSDTTTPARIPFIANTPISLANTGLRVRFAGTQLRPDDFWIIAARPDAPNTFVPWELATNRRPHGVRRWLAPLAVIHWPGGNAAGNVVSDCRKRFRPLTNQKVCCTFVVGDGVTSFGDFNSLEEAAAHLPAAGGELCLLPGQHRANLLLEGKKNVRIHGCTWRSLVLPRTETRTKPILHFVDCVGIEVCDLDLVTYDGIAVLIEGRQEGNCRDLRIHATRMVARVHCIRANEAAELRIANNRLHLLDTVAGLTTISLAADDSLVERNTLVLLPFIDATPDGPDTPDDDPTRDPADPCARPEIIYRFPQLVLAYAIKAWTFALVLLIPKQPYRAIGGIHLRAGCERVRLLENQIVGGAGNGITLGGDLDSPLPAPELVTGVTAAKEQPVSVNVDASGQFLAMVQNEAGVPQENIDVYLEAPTADASTTTDRSDADGLASVKSEPGRHLLDVAPKFRIVRVAETRDQGMLVNAITVAPRASIGKTQAFLHEITIEGNNVSMMGLSGIGFALRAGAKLSGKSVDLPTNNGKASLLAFVDAALLNLALTPLLRATHPVRDLEVLNNRLHHNLRNPFTEQMLAEAQEIGRGGVSLAIIESAAVRGNHISDNGATAIDPSCGVFVGWGNDVEVTDNTIAGNGAITSDYEEKRRAGLRGGIYVRFTGALVSKLSTSSGRKPALRVHDNRVDQPAGRALTAFAFGPVSIANNVLSSEFTGRFGFIDTAFGCVLIGNLGGVHRLIARLAGSRIDNTKSFATLAESLLPGGETIFDDNYVRLDAVNRSLMAQALICLDDLGYASNTSSVYRGDPFFCNTVLIGDTVRATGGRLREDASRALSMLTLALRANITSQNQADHCIFALPSATGTHVPRTVDAPNQIFDSTFCRKDDGTPASVGSFAAPALSAQAAQLGGTIGADAFSSAEVNSLAQGYTMASIIQVNTSQVAVTRAYQAEAVRIETKLGADHPKARVLNDQAEAGVTTHRLLAIGAEAGATRTPSVPDSGSAVSGRLINTKGQGQAGHTVELVSNGGTPAAILGRSDSNGAFGASFSSKDTERLSGLGKLLPRVLDAAGKEVLLSKDVVVVTAGANVQMALILPVRIVPRWVALTGTVIYGPPPKPVTVPDVVGKTGNAAKAAIGNAGLTAEVSTRETEQENVGQVLEQAPNAGSEAALGSAVKIVLGVPGPTVAVPSVTGVSLREAQALIGKAELVVGKVQPPGAPAQAKVIGQSPVAGVQVEGGSTVDLDVEIPIERVQVPTVLKRTLSEARKLIVKVGLTIGTIKPAGASAGSIVVEQSPEPNTSVAAGSPVHLGAKVQDKVAVPNVIDARLSAAQEALEKVKLKIGKINPADAAGDTIVAEQTPAAGIEVDEGSAVDLAVRVATNGGPRRSPAIGGKPKSSKPRRRSKP